jgi:hypothetical protein
VILCFVDYLTGLPELTHTLLMYEGVIEHVEYEADTSAEGSLSFLVTCSNLFASLDDSAPYYTSKTFMNQIAPGDISYDQIYEGSSGVLLRWGKAS